MNRNLFWKLAESQHTRAESFCRRLEGNKDDGDDLYHEALIKAWRNFVKLRRLESFNSWFYQIIINMFKSRSRRRRWEEPAAQVDKTAGPSDDPSPRLLARLNLERAFRALSADDRAMICMYEIEGWNIAEIARIFKKPEGTIKSRLSRARGKMRKELGKCFSAKKKEMREIGADYAMPRSQTSLE